MSHFEAPSSVAGDDVEHHHAPTIRVIAKMRTGPKISFQISNPNRTQPTVPSPEQMAYATPSGMYLRSKATRISPWAKRVAARLQYMASGGIPAFTLSSTFYLQIST